MPDAKEGISYVRSLAWPIVAVVSLVVFGGPLRRTVELLPDILSSADTVEVGKVKLHISGVIARPTAQTQKALEDFDFSDVQFMMDNPCNEGSLTTYTDSIADDEKAFWERMAALKLVVILSDKELKAESEKAREKRVFGVRAEGLYVAVRKYLIELTTNLARRAATTSKVTSDKK
jgi:hypothetical protein